MSKTFHLNSLMVLISIFLNGCLYENSGHKPPVSGDIKIHKNHKNQICFEPEFDSANVASNSFELNSVTKTSFVLHLVHKKNPPAKFTDIWQFNIDKKYYGNSVCINNNDILKSDSSYVVCMYGYNERDKIDINFCQEFYLDSNFSISLDKQI